MPPSDNTDAAQEGGVRRADIRQVAKQAGVSIATVSRVMNRFSSVDPQLADRVLEAAAALNYRPNTQARALVSGKSLLLGLIISEITNPFFPELIQQFEEVAVEHGYEILVGSTSYSPEKMERCAHRMLERKVDGVAIMTFGVEQFFLDRLSGENMRLVCIDVSSEQPRTATLCIDYQMGIREGVQHLAVLGHRKIGFISGPLRLHSAQARQASFVDSLRLIGLHPTRAWMIEGDHTLEGGREAMNKLLKLTDQPTAIMCSNDMTAIGVQHALFEAGLRVPDDLSIIGFDDIHLADFTMPPLTTVRMSCRDIARSAVLNLLGIPSLGRVTSDASRIHIPTKLVVRRTTDVPRNSLTDLRSPTFS